jgi:hypothetical protein
MPLALLRERGRITSPSTERRTPMENPHLKALKGTMRQACREAEQACNWANLNLTEDEHDLVDMAHHVSDTEDEVIELCDYFMEFQSEAKES